MTPRRGEFRRVLTALSFIGPNLLGFLAFTLLPLALSFAMAFTNYDLKRHNPLKIAQDGPDPIQFVGTENFARVFSDARFAEHLGNTLFLMMGIPLNVAGSLFLAVMLSRDLSVSSGLKTNRRRPMTAMIVAGTVVVFSSTMLALIGAGGSAMMILITSLIGGVLLLGMAGGSTVYRTLFYLPNFTAGVAVYMLWKRLYSVRGPVNTPLVGPLHDLTEALRGSSTLRTVFAVLGAALLATSAGAAIWAIRIVRRRWMDADLGTGSLLACATLVAVPAALMVRWFAGGLGVTEAGSLLGVALLADVLLAGLIVAVVVPGGRFRVVKRFEGIGGGVLLGFMFMAVELLLLGLGMAVHQAPGAALARNGLSPPDWLNSFAWAKPALMIMGFWASVGSNNMLLYLAGISNVPPELYEAADIDGAGRTAKFWNITWPQLAPTTFFIVVMSTISGLQGGFDAARVMTEGAAGTTTLVYSIFLRGMMEGSMGQAAAIAWVLFAMVFVVTVFNWKVGNRYVND